MRLELPGNIGRDAACRVSDDSGIADRATETGKLRPYTLAGVQGATVCWAQPLS
jgi:hypothetical protein